MATRLPGMRRYCTYFDHRYLDRGLAMIRSLRQVDPDCQVHVLALTESCVQAIAGLREPSVVLIRLADFEREDRELAASKSKRSHRDYSFMLASCLTAFLLRQADVGEVITYLDADLFFYASPAPLFDAMEGSSVGLVGHRHHWWTRRLEKYGRLNVGWVSFRANEAGRRAAEWWRASCIEWCHGFLDGDRFADQKYLDHMAVRLPGVVEIAHPGANVGPWNLCRHSLSRGSDGGFVVDGRFPLVFFHYSGVRESETDVYLCSNISYLCPFSRFVREELYRPYLAHLKNIRAALGGLPIEQTPDLAGSLPAHRARIAPLLRAFGRLMGHYVSL